MSVQLAILGFMLEGEHYGYEIKKLIENKMGMWTDIKFGSIYNALSNLEKAGFVEKVRVSGTPGKPARSIYRINTEGKREFERLLEENLTLLKRVYLKEDIGVYFGDRLQRNKLDNLLQHKIDVLKEVHHLLEVHRNEMDGYSPEKANTARWMITHHLMHINAELEWFRLIRRELARGALYQHRRRKPKGRQVK